MISETANQIQNFVFIQLLQGDRQSVLHVRGDFSSGVTYDNDLSGAPARWTVSTRVGQDTCSDKLEV